MSVTNKSNKFLAIKNCRILKVAYFFSAMVVSQKSKVTMLEILVDNNLYSRCREGKRMIKEYIYNAKVNTLKQILDRNFKFFEICTIRTLVFI